MDLSAELKKIDLLERPPRIVMTVTKTLPTNEVQQLIKGLCFYGMHYDHLFQVMGKLNTAGIKHDDLIENAAFFEQFISPDSETIKAKTVTGVIEEHRKAYSDQTGSHPSAAVPADCFSDAVYNDLPDALREILQLITERRKKDVCLIGLITALSGAFTRYRFFHGSGSDVKEYSPHILSLVIGPAGSGKGMTRYGNVIVDAITRRALEMKEAAIKTYKKEKAKYDSERKRREKENISIDDLEEPARPIKYAFALSASDTTQAALVEILHHNPMGGFAFDSELDTLVQGNAKRDFGGFSDVIRKVFHHEPLARQRKGEGESYIVNSPRLALSLSGTHDQLKKLISSESNGLFSRLWYYAIPPTFIPYSMRTEQRDIIGETCTRLQFETLTKANIWGNDLIHLEFTSAQEQELYVDMQDKAGIEEKHGGDISASWLRMALITKRIAVTLAAFDGAVAGPVPDRCWKAALALLPALKSHCLKALEVVRSNQGKLEIQKDSYDQLKSQGLTDEQIAKQLGCSVKTLQRRKLDWTK